MKYPWRQKATEESSQSEKLPAGVYDVTIERVVHGKKDGTPFKSKHDDPQIMVIFADDQDREAAMMVTLSAKAGWVLAKILGAANCDLAHFEDTNIGVLDFADPEFAKTNLVGLTLRIKVSFGRDAEYPDILPLKREGAGLMPTEPEPRKAAPSAKPLPAYDPNDDSIPF
ncbi:MAG: hypothetical protein IMZ46_01630 [Acidobacteria bacterium]|nr:hypothetical protein [Acidobacteriota bacterium]